jgi:hypothetical protein
LLKRIQVLLFLFLLAQGYKSCSLIRYEYCKLAIGKKCELSTRHFSGNSDSDLPKFKRKYRTKGIQVIMPHIALLSFRQVNLSTDLILPRVKSNGTFHIHYVQGKRGPPAC